jgi:hypothetical protein
VQVIFESGMLLNKNIKILLNYFLGSGYFNINGSQLGGRSQEMAGAAEAS